jgi:hypothetical protein
MYPLFEMHLANGEHHVKSKHDESGDGVRGPFQTQTHLKLGLQTNKLVDYYIISFFFLEFSRFYYRDTIVRLTRSRNVRHCNTSTTHRDTHTQILLTLQGLCIGYGCINLVAFYCLYTWDAKEAAMQQELYHCTINRQPSTSQQSFMTLPPYEPPPPAYTTMERNTLHR